MRFSKIILTGVCLLITQSALRAQDIEEVERGLFSTTPIVLNEGALPQSNLMIKSAVNLAGELTITAGSSDELAVTYQKRAKTSSR